MEAEVRTVRVGAIPSGLTAPPPLQPPRFFTGRMPFLPTNQQRQSTEGQLSAQIQQLKSLQFFPSYLRPLGRLLPSAWTQDYTGRPGSRG